ncbi:MAG: histidinol-phosphate transaminase [Limimaricola sp.]|uniref:histidinol-phosphate transaminase n=1 Tax=Limimaricola sp. TaxID=2211665 RepID=UPI001D469103|nr:histidinol-phosphate transaminase [Limimaricola sp.]MBI1417780.1 histidinol-phosphate transaminase [Limimaricola sp.]
MAPKIEPQPGIMDIALYQGGQSALPGQGDVLKLSSNENHYGFSDKAREAFQKSARTLNRYPGTDHGALRTAIGEIHGIDPDRVICGVGSDEVLQFVAQAYAGPGTEVIHTQHGFAMYPILARAVGATPVAVPEVDRTVDVDAILRACTAKTRIVFLTNPGNPTGTMLPEEEVARLAEGLPPRAILVIDSAYVEFAEGRDGGIALVEARENVVMTRTFSKLYGLGGLRIGWGYGPQTIIDVLNRIRQPFNLSDTQLVTAEAALRDRDFAERCVHENAKWRAWMAGRLNEIGVDCDPSFTNFVLARFENEDEALACDAHLKSQRIIVRHVANYGLPHCLRITVGDESACRRVVHAIAQFKGARVKEAVE